MTADRLVIAAQLAVEHTAARLVGAFDESGVANMVLKGTLQARLLHGAVRRAPVDVDLLVAPASLTAAEAVLAGLGYLRVVETTGGHEPGHAHDWRREGAVPVDLHWSLAGADPACLWGALSRATSTSLVAGVPVRVPDAAGTALVVSLHAAQHGSGAAPVLDDLARALVVVEAGDWRRAAGLAREAGAEAAFAAGLGLLPEGRGLASALGLAQGAVSVETALGLVTAAHTADGFQRFAEADGLVARAHLVVEKLTPSPGFMRHKYALANRGRAGLALAYLYRPLWLAWWAPRGYLAWRRAKRVAAASQRDGERRP